MNPQRVITGEAMTTIDIIVQQIERKQSSPNGNPRWKITATDGRVYLTKPDTMDAIKLSGNEHGHTMRLTLNGNGEIIGVDR